MIGIQKQTNKFSLGTFFLVFFFGFVIYSNFNNNVIHAEESTAAEIQAAAKPLALPINTSSKTFNNAAKFLNQTPVEATGNIVVQGFKWFLYGVFTLCAFLAMLAAEIFSYVLDVSHLQAIMNNPVVWEMWKVVRDFFNLFFIFGLLLVAFSTIFQVSKFGGLKSIWSIVLAALFINFSFPIARMIIDVGNVMMYSFIVDIFGMTGKTLTSGVLSTSGLKGLFLLSENNLDFTIKYYLIAIICMFMFGVSFLTLALMMFYRLFMLPILVMFAPLGFAGAIPGFGGYSKQWWDKLIKNVFFGPIAVFMIMLAVKFMSTLGNSKNNPITSSMVASNSASDDFLSSIVYMTIPIIFFWIAITSAEKLSSEASGMANSFGSKFLKWGGGLPWRGTKEIGKWGGRKIESKLASKGGKWKYLSPTVVTTAFKAWSETSKHEDMLPIEMAKAEMHNDINAFVGKVAHSRFGKYLPLHQDSTDNKMLEQTRQMKKYEDEIKQRGGGEISEEVAVAFLAEGLNDHHEVKMLAAAAALPKTNGLDNITHALAKRYGMVPGDRMNEKGEIEHAGIVGVDGKPSISVTDNYIPLMMKAMSEAGVDEQLQLKHLYNMGEVAKSKGDLSYGDWVEIKADGTYRLRTPEEHAEVVGKNFAKGKAQTRQDILHGRGLFEQNIGPDPNNPDNTAWGDLNLAGMSVAANFNADDVNSHSRNRGDLPKAVVSAFKAAQDPDPAVRARVANFIKAYNANEHFRNYIWAKQGNDPKGFDKNPPPKLSVEAGGTTKKSSGSSSGGKGSSYAPGVKAEDMKII